MVILAHIDTDQTAGLEDIETAKLWVQGGHGDLTRSLAALQAFASQQTSASIGHRIVYGKASL